MQQVVEFYVIKHDIKSFLRHEGYKSPAKKEESQLCREQQMFVRLSLDIPSINPRSNGTFLRELCQIGYCESRAKKHLQL